jgi:uncharacterized protein (DUF1778 family)
MQADSGRKVVNMRVPEAALVRIDRAAELSGSSRTDFMVKAAEIAASHVLADQTAFKLDARAYKAFVDALDASPQSPSPALVELLRTRAPWER